MKTDELTGNQTVSFSFSNGILITPSYATRGTYTQLRAVRKDPSISLARRLLISSILAGSWNIEADEDVSSDVTEFMEHILKLRDDFLYNCIAYGQVDFGWIGFEKVFGVEGDKIIIERLKPLLHDITLILVTPQGHFNGYRQNPMTGTPLDVPVEKCLHVAFGIEAGNLYGTPLLEYIRQTSDMWHECNDGARRYDKKMAGSHWIVKYPPGTGTVDGKSVDNSVIAGQILTAMTSAGSVAMPTTVASVLQEMTNVTVAELYAWQVELICDKGGKQISFNDRLKYLDSQKVRGLGFPERAILEGQFGTKAEAGVHGDMAALTFEQVDRAIVTAANEQLVDQLIELNFGPEMVGKVRLVALPLVDEQVKFLREVYVKLSDPNLDVETLRNKLDLPTEENGNKIPEPAAINDVTSRKEDEDV